MFLGGAVIRYVVHSRNVFGARLKQFGMLVLVAPVVTGKWFHNCEPAAANARCRRRPNRSVATPGTQRSAAVAECSRIKNSTSKIVADES